MQKAPVRLPVLLDALCMGVLPSNQAIHFAKEKTTGSAFGVCKRLQWVKVHNREEDWNLQSSWISKTKHHGPQVGVYIVLGGYLSQAHGIHAAQKFPNKPGRLQYRMFAPQQHPTASYKYLLCAASFEAHEALGLAGAAVSHAPTAEEFHFKMKEGLQDLAFPLF